MVFQRKGSHEGY